MKKNNIPVTDEAGICQNPEEAETFVSSEFNTEPSRSVFWDAL